MKAQPGRVEDSALTRRGLMQGALGMLAPAVLSAKSLRPDKPSRGSRRAARRECPPAGVRSRFVENVNGIRFHVLEAGYEIAPGDLAS